MSLYYYKLKNLINWINWAIVDNTSCDHIQISVAVHINPFDFVIKEWIVLSLWMIAAGSHEDSCITWFLGVSVKKTNTAVVYIGWKESGTD